MAFRIAPTILDDAGSGGNATAGGIDPLARVDADLIIATVMVGFVAGRAAVGHPLTFSWDDQKDEQPTQLAAELVRRAASLDDRALTVDQTVPWEVGAMITGAAGAAAAPFSTRHAQPSAQAAAQLREIAARDTSVGYQGFGAYTGFVDDPINDRGSVQSTFRLNVPEDGFGERWRPPAYTYPVENAAEEQFKAGKLKLDDPRKTDDNAPWGLVNNGNDIKDMASVQYVAGGVVGYTHGMIQAIYSSVAEGPWCTPFEIAVGTKTTKLASCFACTTFMYGAGYPPSAIHIGRSDSWQPFYPKNPGEDGYSMQVDEGIRSTNARWHLECLQHLMLGIDLLGKPDMLHDPHADRLVPLHEFVEARSQDVFCAGNLFLDALTIPGSLTTRIPNVIRPA